MTKVHQLFSKTTTYGPAQLKVLGTAFDGAWASIAGRFGDKPSAETARTTLANIILSLPYSEIDDAEGIKTAALGVMAVGYRDGSAA